MDEKALDAIVSAILTSAVFAHTGNSQMPIPDILNVYREMIRLAADRGGVGK